MQTVLETFLAQRVVPVLTLPDPDLALKLGETLLEAGIGIAEVTFRAEGADKAIRLLRQHFPELLVGAGTVLKPEQADRAADAGAQFLMAPGFNPRVVEAVRRTGVPFIPGVLTPTEIELAVSEGFQLLKLFPAEVSGGPSLLKALAGPYPQVKFVPTGGVNAKNLASYVALKNVAAVGSGDLAPADLIERQDWAEIGRRAAEYRNQLSLF